MSVFALEDGVIYHTYLGVRARAGRAVGHVSVARPRATRAQRNDGFKDLATLHAGGWYRRHDEYDSW